MADQPEPPPPAPVVRRGGETLGGSRLGDRRVRVSRPERQQIPVRVRAFRPPRLHAALVFVLGFAILILVGTIALSLPIASAQGQWTSFLVALFTATSAVCVTGLVVVDTGTYWSGFGQVVILLLIQAGGFGFMTSSSLLFLLIGRRISLRERVLLRESLGTGSLESIVSLVRKIALFTLVAEVVGAVVLTAGFLGEMEAHQALWSGVFHAVSAFNNAGFDVIGGFRSLMPYNQNPVIVLSIAVLFIVGGISFTVVHDLVKEHRFVRLSLDTKLVLATTAVLIVVGTLGILFTERANPATLGEMPTGSRLLHAFFTAVTPRTAGFNTVDTGSITDNGLFFLAALMFIGAAAGSTAGGIKLQTFSLLFFAIISAARGASDVEAFRKRVSTPALLRAIAVALLSLALVFLVTYSLSVTEDFSFLRILFEATSAFGTVGLSTGITPDLSAAGRLIVILTMFAGRLGPLTLVVALAARERRPAYRWSEENVKIG